MAQSARRPVTRRQFGTIDKLPSGRWGVRYRVDGKPVSPGLTFATRADAGAYLDSVRTDMDRG
ncbi:MAG TPA: hypothetical protein VMY88_03395, partial [Acidimicrobiales bacterium]|nr:hypothetical protein [Acidimicrobiales bacterium]